VNYVDFVTLLGGGLPRVPRKLVYSKCSVHSSYSKYLSSSGMAKSELDNFCECRWGSKVFVKA
jgi:hypothetical protein